MVTRKIWLQMKGQAPCDSVVELQHFSTHHLCLEVSAHLEPPQPGMMSEMDPLGWTLARSDRQGGLPFHSSTRLRPDDGASDTHHVVGDG